MSVEDINTLKDSHASGSHTRDVTTQPTVSVKSKKRKRPTLEDISPDDNVHYPWLSRLSESKSYTSTFDKLHDELVAYSEWARPDNAEIAARQSVVRTLRQTIWKMFSRPQSELHMFGSSATGLSLPDADLDLAVEVPGQYTAGKSTKNMLYKLSRRISNIPYFTQAEPRVIARAKVPIIAFITSPTYGSLQVDLGLNNLDGLGGVAFVRKQLQLFPALKPLILSIKAILARWQLNDPAVGGLGSYGVILLCIGFIKLNPQGRPQEWINDSFTHHSLGHLLFDFFNYFGRDFPASSSYLCPAEGTVVSRRGASWIQEASMLAVQDPLNPTNNVTKSLQRYELIQDMFKACSAKLVSASTDDETTLGLLFGVTQETLDHRALLRSVAPAGARAAPSIPSSSQHVQDRRPNKSARRALPSDPLPSPAAAAAPHHRQNLTPSHHQIPPRPRSPTKLQQHIGSSFPEPGELRINGAAKRTREQAEVQASSSSSPASQFPKAEKRKKGNTQAKAAYFGASRRKDL